MTMTHRNFRASYLACAGMALIATGLVTTIRTPAQAATGGAFIRLPASAALSDAQLARVRGGFDLTPKITVDFAYRQVTSVDGTVIAAVAIPQIQIALGRNHAPQVTSVSPTPTTTPPTTIPPPVPLPGSAPIVSHYGNTSVSTQFGANGISTVITNMANNVRIQHQVNVDIGLTGMPAMLASQAQAMVVTQALTNATQQTH